MTEITEHLWFPIMSGVVVLIFGYLVISINKLLRSQQDIENIKLTVGDHDKKFERVVWRDQCERSQTICHSNRKERQSTEKDQHTEVIKRMDKIELRIDGLGNQLSSCMDDLVDALRGKSDVG